jgi:type II secretory ATPase GspE/PulE/Tfp pilus assembly ATPase PilB-like protein
MLYAEKVCMRLIYKARDQFSLTKLGYSDHNYRIYKEMVESPTGLLLHCGPAGSGKTTAVYAAIHYLNDASRNISTVEDPIEYQIDGVNQAQVNPDIDLTFGKILRAYLRQDCNVILVGEIRDKETADIAIEAALTGHKILGTLHTMSAVGTIIRLQEMEISNYFIGAAITGIVSQRLVRKLCEKCKVPTTPPPQIAAALGLPDGQPVFKPVGCRNCMNTGYKGRMAIHEILKADEPIKQLIYDGQSPLQMEATALQMQPNTMVPMATDGLAKAAKGDTSLEEVVRVVKGISTEALKPKAPSGAHPVRR